MHPHKNTDGDPNSVRVSGEVVSFCNSDPTNKQTLLKHEQKIVVVKLSLKKRDLDSP